jgi:hypothetical protein
MRTRPWRRAEAGGWLIVGLVIILAGVFTVLTGVVLAVGEGWRAIALRRQQARAVYLAQAGVMEALYDFRRNRYITLGERTVVDDGLPGTTGDDVFILGGMAADFLLANMIPATVSRLLLGGVRRDVLRDWRLHNTLRLATSPAGIPMIITHMTVSWDDPQPGEGVIRIEVEGRGRVWPPAGQTSPPQPSGTELNIRDVTIPPRAWRTDNWIWFATDGVMDGKLWIAVAFRMSDHVPGDPLRTSVRRARYDDANPLASSAEFTVKSVGEARRSAFPFSVWRRLSAEYRICAEVTQVPDCNSVREEREERGRLLAYRELTGKTP